MKPAFDVKPARLNALAVQPYTADLTELEGFLHQCAGQYQELDVVPLILDVQNSDHPESLNTGAMVSLFARYGMQILGLRHTSEIWVPYAARLHLMFTLGDSVPAEPQPKAATPTPVQAPAVGNPTILVSTSIRTGQQVYAESADLIVTGAVSQDAELITGGNVHVYAPIRGRALADVGNNRNARIFIHSMQAELVFATGIYRNFEQGLPDHLCKKPVQILSQDNRLVINAVDAE